VHRAVDQVGQVGQVIDVHVAQRRDGAAARRFFERALVTTAVTPVEVVTDRAAVITGHAFIQNIRRGFYELAVDEPVQLRVAVAFTELTHAV